MSEETVNFDCGVPYHENQVKKLREQRKKLIEEVEALDRSIDDQLKVIKSLKRASVIPSTSTSVSEGGESMNGKKRKLVVKNSDEGESDEEYPPRKRRYNTRSAAANSDDDDDSNVPNRAEIEFDATPVNTRKRLTRLKKKNDKTKKRKKALENMREKYGDPDHDSSSSDDDSVDAAERQHKILNAPVDDFIVPDDVVEHEPPSPSQNSIVIDLNEENNEEEDDHDAEKRAESSIPQAMSERPQEEDEIEDHKEAPVVPRIFTDDRPSLSSQSIAITPKKAFGVMVQYFVSCLLDADFSRLIRKDRNDDYFGPSINKIFKRLSQTKESLVGGTVWSSDLVEDLNTLVELTHNSIDDGEDCEACRRSKHPATTEVNLSEFRIDTDLYASSLKSRIRFFKKSTFISYGVGRYCFKRIVAYHIMHHYKYHMIQCLNDRVKIIQSEHVDYSQKQIVDKIDLEDVPKLYSGYKHLLDIGNSFLKTTWMRSDEEIDYYVELAKVFPVIRGAVSPVPVIFVDDSDTDSS